MALIDTRAPQLPVDPNRTARAPAKRELPPEQKGRLKDLTEKRLQRWNGLDGQEARELWGLQQQAGAVMRGPAPLLPHQEIAQQVPEPIHQELSEQLSNIELLREQAKSIGLQYQGVEASAKQLSEMLPFISEGSQGEATERFNALNEQMGQLGTQMAEVQGQITKSDSALNEQIAEYLKHKDPKFLAQAQKVDDLTHLTTSLDTIAQEMAKGGEGLPAAVKAYNDAVNKLLAQGSSLVSYADRITQREGSSHTAEELEFIKEGLQSKLNTGRITYANYVLSVRQQMLGR